MKLARLTTVLEDRDGNVWIGSRSGLFRYQDGHGVRPLQPPGRPARRRRQRAVRGPRGQPVGGHALGRPGPVQRPHRGPPHRPAQPAQPVDQRRGRGGRRDVVGRHGARPDPLARRTGAHLHQRRRPARRRGHGGAPGPPRRAVGGHRAGPGAPAGRTLRRRSPASPRRSARFTSMPPTATACGPAPATDCCGSRATPSSASPCRPGCWGPAAARSGPSPATTRTCCGCRPTARCCACQAISCSGTARCRWLAPAAGRPGRCARSPATPTARCGWAAATGLLRRRQGRWRLFGRDRGRASGRTCSRWRPTITGTCGSG